MRTRISAEELESKIGRVLTSRDVNLLVTGPALLLKPDGKPLCVYLPAAVDHEMSGVWPLLKTIKMGTDNRGLASGTERVEAGGKRSRTMPVLSGILGAMDSGPGRGYCRLTNYTREHVTTWATLAPLLRDISSHFRDNVPSRYDAQMAYVRETEPEWTVEGTPFSTITVNNSYSTGVHTDKGDLDAGFSCLAVGREGEFSGGWLCFPEYRVGVDMKHGDLLLMDAHEWHGNTPLVCRCGKRMAREPCKICGAERVSVVCYFRTKMAKCGTIETENQKRVAALESRSTVDV